MGNYVNFSSPLYGNLGGYGEVKFTGF